MVEFFFELFDILGDELLAMVEEFRNHGKVCGALNATFFSLIPQNDKLESFKDFRPIALWNLVYQIISKIIANKIKPFLSKHISKEQFGFLDKRQIMDAIGVAQEGMHNIKVKKMNSLVLKLHLFFQSFEVRPYKGLW